MLLPSYLSTPHQHLPPPPLLLTCPCASHIHIIGTTAHIAACPGRRVLAASSWALLDCVGTSAVSLVAPSLRIEGERKLPFERGARTLLIDRACTGWNDAKWSRFCSEKFDFYLCSVSCACKLTPHSISPLPPSSPHVPRRRRPRSLCCDGWAALSEGGGAPVWLAYNRRF